MGSAIHQLAGSGHAHDLASALLVSDFQFDAPVGDLARLGQSWPVWACLGLSP
jgi:hypothetical protein